MTDANIYSTKFQQNLKSLFNGETLVLSGDDSTVTATTTFSPTGGNIFFITPSGANREFNPSGTFDKNTKIELINTGATYNVIFDSEGSSQSVATSQYGNFFFDGTTWH